MDAGKAAAAWPDADPLTGVPVPENAVSRVSENEAAKKAGRHASTPSVTFLDSLGRPFLTMADNGLDNSGAKQEYKTRGKLDIDGNLLEITDAADRTVMRYNYDVPGRRIRQAGMEAGERLTLSDAAGNIIYAWDSRGHTLRTVYDGLRRPTEVNLQEGGEPELLAQRTVYGETLPNPETNNLRGKVVQVFDGAGAATSDEYDFKGNLQQSGRQLAAAYKTVPDWSAPVPMEAETHTSRTVCDALNRPVFLTAPDGSSIRLTYNDTGLLEQVEACLRAAAATTPFVKNIGYNAKGQRESIEYGNGVSTSYTYDPLTFRLARLLTTRGAERLQDLRYTYDPAGNVTDILDHAQQNIFFNNTLVEPRFAYTYDAVYRLIEAAGREHLGQSGGQQNPPAPPDAFNHSHTRLDHPGDGSAMGTYVETYVYDTVGNILSLQHRGAHPAHPGWRRAYTYSEASLLEPGRVNNRLSSASTGTTTENYRYDGPAGLQGNITAMPHLPTMRWDYRDRLQAVSRQVLNGGTPETTYYVYDAAGQRVRKVTERQAAAGQTPARKNERIYLGGFEIYREYGADGGTATLEREALHLMDGRQRIALAETRTLGSDTAPARLIRYQIGNHLGSACLELDAAARMISYEEYYPYGSTSYQAVRSRTETPKRYRYTGKERDEESGFSYHGARYYAPWLGRWTSPDPAGPAAGVNSYSYVSNNPIIKEDPTGFEEVISEITTTAGNRTFYHIVDWRNFLLEFPEEEFSQVGEALADIEKEGFYVSKGANAIYGEGLYTFTEEYQALGLAVSQERPYAAFTVAPETEVVEVVINTGKSTKYYAIIKASSEGEKVMPTSLTFRNMSQLQESVYQKTVAAESFAKAPLSSASAGKAPALGQTAVKVFKGLVVLGAFLSGVQIGQGINQAREGKTGEGTVDIVAGTSNLSLLFLTEMGTKSGAIAVEGGLAAGGVALAAGVAATGSIFLATEEVKRSLRGEDTMIYEAAKYYSDLVEAGKDEGGFSGFGMQAAGWAGGLITAPLALIQGY
jgi:RHS repeat-associated protein